MADEIANSVSGSVSKELFNNESNLEYLEFRCFSDFSGDRTLLNPKWILQYRQNVNVALGAEIFDGSDYHPLGFYRDNDQIFLRLECII